MDVWRSDISCDRQNNRQTGAYYEQLAAEYLKQQGYIIMERNFRCKLGEVDIIALHHNTLVFIEVKYRARADWGQPSDAVNRQKQMRISNVASYYVYTHKQFANHNCRFDVVSIAGNEITLYPNAFLYCGRFSR